MKRSAAILSFLLLISFNNYGQKGWFWLNPKPEGNTLNDVALFGDGYAVAPGRAWQLFYQAAEKLISFAAKM